MPNKPRGIYIVPELIDSKAYMELSGTAAKVLIWFLRRRQVSKVGRKGKQKWSIINNGKIVFSYAEAENKYGLTRPRFARAINDLIEKGFIDIAHHGGGMMGDCTLYAISERWRYYGTDQFISQSRPKDTRGLGFNKKNWEKRTGKKRKASPKQGNNTDTYLNNINITLENSSISTASNKNDAEQNRRKALILNAMRQYTDICNRSNQNVTVL